ncbi:MULTISPECIES: hypothetical protein [unclassified Bradyrhizobium]|uniref:hypothetical protein n=1 Tax=unclassified Bradyrhizobium TaxID=2631580 RepID=UPI001FF72015|nr:MULTISPECIES: hypothetical protein [unclassified Bradyrhizobium]
MSNATPATTSAIPAEFQALCPAPQLLPGESIDHYRALQTVIFRDIAPQSAIEWLLAIDVAELSWEMQRYRILRHKLLESYRQNAIEMTLRRIDVPGIVPDFENDAEHYIIQNALDWRLDRIAADEIEARLASYGFDQHAISVEVYVQAREIFTLFETLMNAAQLRRLFLLKEINSRRRMQDPANFVRAQPQLR